MARLAVISSTTGVPEEYLAAEEPVSCIEEGRLYLGGQATAADQELLSRLRVTHVLNCARECVDLFPGSVQYMRLNLIDTDRQTIDFDRGADWVRDALEDQRSVVLIHCLSGISRSAVVTASFLVKHRHVQPAEALAHVKSRRSVAKPLTAFRMQLFAWASSLRPVNPQKHQP